MAAYAALVSLTTTLNNLQIHPRVSTFFHHEQIQSLHQIINVLLDFIESSNSHGGSREVEALESRVASTAHAAEDAIESHVVDQIPVDEARRKKLEASNLFGTFRRLTSCARPTRYATDCLLDLEKVIEAMNSIKETVVTEFPGQGKFEDAQSSHSMSAASSKPAATEKGFMVGFDEKLIQIMDRLTGQETDLQIVPIVGMGGIGKTTLAKSVYDNLLIVESFDIRAWVTISQEYSVKYVLSELLSCIKDRTVNISIGAVDFETDLESEDHQLGLILYKTLWGRRYLIVLDDMWSVEAWDRIKFFFPNNDDRSRVVITTRIMSVATALSSSSFEMNFLDDDQSWELFCRNVFLGKGCPPELEEIGKKIVRECKGLPLSIVVIGGLLRNSTSTREYWEDFARDLNSILISKNDEHCFKILSLSYNHLPVHLKPCFLYMGVYREDRKIHVSNLIDLFVAEGFLKPKEGQTLEEVAEDYLHDLVDRNLILVDSWRWNGTIKHCKLHDLVREICLKIGVREKFFYVMRKYEIPTDERRILFDCVMPENDRSNVFETLPSAPLVRSMNFFNGDSLSFKLKLLRVMNYFSLGPLEYIFQHINLRYILWTPIHPNSYRKLPSSVSLLWNVHMLILLFDDRVVAPSEIWYMRQLRHLVFHSLILPVPPPSKKAEQQDEALLPNLHTLSVVVNFSFTEEVCKKIPNVKKLSVVYNNAYENVTRKKWSHHLVHLHKLQSLRCSFETLTRDDLLQSLVFPCSLRKLCLSHSGLHWEDLNTFGLSLPNLQVLKLKQSAVVGSEWHCVEGAFSSLKELHIHWVGLKKWTAESYEFFPVLQKLHLGYLSTLEEIPSGIGEIQKLEFIRVHRCSMSASISSTERLEEQLSLGNEDLQLVVIVRNEEEKSIMENQVEMKSFTTKNFKIELHNQEFQD